MVQKNKNHQNNITESFTSTAAHLGMVAMIFATVAATAEMAVHEGQKMSAVLQPHATYAAATAQVEHQPGHELRRSGGPKEEVQHSSASYGSMKRSEAVAGPM